MNRVECIRRLKNLPKEDVEFIVNEAKKVLEAMKAPPPKPVQAENYRRFERESAASAFDSFTMGAFNKHHGGMNFGGEDWDDSF